MSNYRSHTLFNLFFLLPLSTLSVFYFFVPSRFNLLLYIGTFTYATCFMTPDADIANKIKLLSLRGVMTLPFRPYSMLFSHRGISHIPIIGTLTRIGWICGCFFLIYTFIYNHTFSFHPIIEFYHTHTLSIHYTLSALFVSDIGHLILDKK
ncbi:MAG: DUF2227 family putative metal-binding protein [Rhabdochlamydiaceae bacterium]|nr:DUF2227 family putative metal-binding protein [Candidatus Amphrikana amoebophyrae]